MDLRRLAVVTIQAEFWSAAQESNLECPTGIEPVTPVGVSNHTPLLFWSFRVDLNHWPLPYQGSALPPELRKHVCTGGR